MNRRPRAILLLDAAALAGCQRSGPAAPAGGDVRATVQQAQAAGAAAADRHALSACGP